MNVEADAPHIDGKFRQYIVAIAVNALAFMSGQIWGWPSPALPQLRSSNTPVGDVPMNEYQISLISGSIAIGGFIITPFCSTLTERIGRKNFAHLTGLPHIVSWLLLIFGQDFASIIAARIVGGMGIGMTIFIIPLYVGETASKDIRGRLGSLTFLHITIGTLVAFIMGAFLSYRLFACLSIIPSLGFVLIFGFLPETPVFLIRRNRPLQAHKSLMFLRGNNRDLVEHELAMIRTQVKTSDNTVNKVKLKEFFNDRSTRKAIIISFGLQASQELCGIFAMISYAETVFQHAGSSISPKISSITIGAIQIVIAYTSTTLIESAGRRLLLIISYIGMIVSHCFVGTFFSLQESHHDMSSISWLPIVALSTFIISYCFGAGPVPYIIVSEIFRLDYSSLATTLSFVCYWFVSFISIQIFSASMQHLGVGGCFYVLAGFCTTSLIFVYYLVPETKGRERQDIIDELAGKLFSHKQTAYRYDDCDHELEAKPVL